MMRINLRSKLIRFFFHEGRLRKYVARHLFEDQDEKSWYKFTWEGWRLYRRESYVGRWWEDPKSGDTNSNPGDASISEVIDPNSDLYWHLREHSGFKPYNIIDWYGEKLEVISYPYPSNDQDVYVNMRKFNDPTTMQRYCLIIGW